MSQRIIKKTQFILYLISSILFFLVALIKIFFDASYFNGVQYLITSIIIFLSFLLVKKSELNIKSLNLINLGFIFLTIGLVELSHTNLNIGLWSLGIIFFLSGVFRK